MDVIFEWVQTNIVSVINTAIIEYGGNSILFLVLIISSLTLLALQKEQLKRGYSAYFAYSMVLCLFVLFNPAILIFFEGLKEAFALFPICSIVAFVFADKHRNITNRFVSNTIVLVLALLMFFGGIQGKSDIYMDAINIYKTDDQGIIIAQNISEHSENKSVTAYYILRDDEHQGEDISACEAAMQFSGKIQVECVPIYEMPDSMDSDYLVIHDDIVEAVSIDSKDYSVVIDTGSYTLFSNTK